MRWLKINEDGEVELTTEEVKLVPELALIHSLKYNKGEGDMDGRKRKRAKQELKYLYLAYSTKSPYKDYSKEERIEEAKKDCEFNTGWEESTELQLLIKKFQQGEKSKFERLLSAAENFLEKLETHLSKVDFDKTDEKGALVYDPNKILTTLQKLPGLAQTIQELELQIRNGNVGNPKSKGDHEIGWMAMQEQDNNNNE